MTTKSVFAIVLLFWFGNVHAQVKRYVDLNVSITQPQDSFIVVSPGTDSCDVRIINKGPNALIKGDEVLIRIQFGGVRFVAKSYPVTATVSKGDTVLQRVYFPAKGTNDADNVELCVHEAYAFTPVNSGLDSVLFFEKDSSRLFKDNSACVVGFHRMATNNIEKIKHNEDLLHVFPNPTSNTVTIAVNQDKIEINRVELIQANGSVVQTMVLEKMRSKVVLQIGDLPAGLYWIKTFTNEGINVHKIVTYD